METAAHMRLKQAVVSLLLEQGYLAVATEVRCPISRYRVDVAGYADRPPAHLAEARGTLFEQSAGLPCLPNGVASAQMQADPRTIIIECKQSRADFLRDRRDLNALLGRRAALDELRERYEQQRLKQDEPELRCSGSSLFAELEQWDFTRARSPGYRRIVRNLRRLDEQLYGQTKFYVINRYALAHRLYLAAPRGMIRPRELPSGWGLLECASRWLKCGGDVDRDPSSIMRVRVAASPRPSPARFCGRLLRNIAIAATRQAYTEPRNAPCHKRSIAD